MVGLGRSIYVSLRMRVSRGEGGLTLLIENEMSPIRPLNPNIIANGGWIRMNIQFSEAVDRQTHDQPPQETYVLQILSVRFRAFSFEMAAHIGKFSNLQMLVLNDCALESLENFPRFYHLIRLDVVANRLKDDCFFHLQPIRRLQCLMMGGNQVSSIDALKQLQNHKDLKQLDLLNNPIQKVEAFRFKVFKVLPQLKVLDTLDINGNDAFMSISMADTAGCFQPTRFQPAQPPLFAFGFGGPLPAFNFPPPAVPQIPLKNKVQSKKLKQKLSRTKSYDSIQNKKTKKNKQQSQSQSQQEPPAPKNTIKKVVAGNSRAIARPPLGKGKGKIATKKISQSQRAGLVFPVNRIARKIKQNFPTLRLSRNSAVYMAAAMQYLSAQLLISAGDMTKRQKLKRINQNILNKTIKEEEFFR